MPSITRSAASKPASRSPLAISNRLQASVDARGSKTGGSGSVRRWIASRAARARAGSGAATSATGSATCRISSATSAGWSSASEAITFSPGMSAAVTTTTCDQSNAGSRSMPSRRACASVARTVAPYHAPGTTRSSVNCEAPVSFAAPSRRTGSTLPVTTVPAGSATMLIGRAWRTASGSATVSPSGVPDRDRAHRRAVRAATRRSCARAGGLGSGRASRSRRRTRASRCTRRSCGRSARCPRRCRSSAGR